MLIYVIDLALVFLLSAILNPRSSDGRKKLFVALSVGILGATAACRGASVGIDTEVYYRAFSSVDYADSYYEPGFLALIWLLNCFTDNPQILIVTTSLFSFFSVGVFIYDNSKNPLLSIVLFVSLLLFASYMNLMRQAMAISVLLFAYRFLVTKRYILFAVLVMIASMFHFSALVWLLLLPLTQVKYTEKTALVYVVALLVSAFMSSQLVKAVALIFGKYGGYLDSKWGGGNSLAAPVMAAMDFSLLFFSWCEIREIGKMQKADFDLLLHGSTIAVLLQVLASVLNIFQRLVPYFSVFLIILVPNALEEAPPKVKTLLITLIVVLGLSFFIVVMIYRPNWQGVVPYIAFWNAV